MKLITKFFLCEFFIRLDNKILIVFLIQKVSYEENQIAIPRDK